MVLFVLTAAAVLEDDGEGPTNGDLIGIEDWRGLCNEMSVYRIRKRMNSYSDLSNIFNITCKVGWGLNGVVLLRGRISW